MNTRWVEMRVHSDTFGAGTIVAERSGGYDVQVRFDNVPLLMWIQRSKVRIIEPIAETTPLAPSPPPANGTQPNEAVRLAPVPASVPVASRKPTTPAGPTASPPLSATPEASDAFAKRKVVEALRLGIVPDDGLALVTEGRAAEVADVQRWLNDANQGAFAVVGQYGIGKTHLLRYIAHSALLEGYAVSFVSANPADSPFSMPKRVYAEVVRSLRWRQGGKQLGFRALVAEGVRHGLLRDHWHFRHLRAQEPDEIWAWAEGRTGGKPVATSAFGGRWFPTLHDNMKTANIYTYLVTSLGALAADRRIGGKGLLVLFDEAESIDLAYSNLAWQRGLNFLNALIACADGESVLTLPPNRAQVEFEHSAYADDLPFLYRAPSHTKVLFSFTLSSTLNQRKRMQAMPRIELDGLDYAAQRSLKTRLTDLYLDAYGLSADAINWTVAKTIGLDADDSVTRRIVKMQIELMDLSRFNR